MTGISSMIGSRDIVEHKAGPREYSLSTSMDRHGNEQVPRASRVAAFTHDDRVDDVIARVAARLQLIRGPLPPLEFDALAHDIVLDVARFVLEWTERGKMLPRAAA